MSKKTKAAHYAERAVAALENVRGQIPRSRLRYAEADFSDARTAIDELKTLGNAAGNETKPEKDPKK